MQKPQFDFVFPDKRRHFCGSLREGAVAVRRLRESVCTENSTESYGYAGSFHHVTFHFVEVSAVPLPLGGRLW